jgi:hypothetical protein
MLLREEEVHGQSQMEINFYISRETMVGNLQPEVVELFVQNLKEKKIIK